MASWRVKWSDETVAGLIVGLIGAFCYLNSLSNGFVSDDRQLILEHPYVTSVSAWPLIFSSGHYAGTGGYRPLTTLSFAFNYFIGDSHPIGFHLINLLLHGFDTALVFLLLNRLLKAKAAAFVGALIFAVHPVHTEAVAWISGRAELLATTFFLIAWLWHIKSRDWPGLSLPRVASLVALFAALLAKENTLIFPVAMICSDLFEQRFLKATMNWSQLWKRAYLPQLLVIAGYFAFRGLLYHQPLLRTPSKIDFIDNPLAHVGLVARVLTAIKVQGQYFGLLLWPAHLSPDYSFNSVPVVTTPIDPGFWIALVAIGFLVAIALSSFLTRGPIWFGLVFYALAILPTSNLLTAIGSIKAERFLYLPSIGFCLVVGAVVANSWARLCDYAQARMGTAIAASMLLCAVSAMAAKTWKQNKIWRDDRTLWINTALAVPDSLKAQLNCGQQDLNAGEFENAIAAFRRAQQIQPDSEDAIINLGGAYLASGRRTETISLNEDALQHNPNCAGCRINLALAEISTGKLDDGIQELRDVVARAPQSALAHYNLAHALSSKGDSSSALQEYHRAVELKPDYAEAWNAIGAIYLKTGQMNDARTALERALILRPSFPEAAHNLELLNSHR